ncbi:chromosome partitioning protein ParB [Sphingopyxis lindanitolerans]|uniref:Chromosome partitioning protein ParB n=1 Tax=Sphingopyxis lindanitolerans TaxID=2054227 RepID=A0A2S8B313_9SPHN|nr:ParB/RepB/Spo0J family partition protein [Sphingopyxis lindanitolerans]PQM26716.1 chromosome partitioning protein ParB [Sphingopyxis lindanitolerans]
MKLDFIDLDKLSIANVNMRGKGRDPDVSDILPSIRARGILVPLLVRPNCDPGRFEIVAGRRRFTAANCIVREGGAARPLPCAILDDGDDADALEASMIENLQRVAPDEVSQWEAFVKLAKTGRSIEEIADKFAFEVKAVKRILALGALLPRIRTLYRAGEIDPATVRQLTLASKSQQTAWLALHDDPQAYCPTGHQLKGWLFGGTAICADHALFDVAASGAVIVSDLFGEQNLFADSEQFWSLQMAEIEARKAGYIEAGWSDVIILERGDWFRTWDYAHAGKRKGGRIYVEVRATGEIGFHEGYLTAKEAEARARGDDVSAPVAKPKRPEATGAMNSYIGLHRHAAVRADLARHGGVALRAMAAHVIAGAGHYRVDLEPRKAPKPDIAASAERAPGETAFDLHRRAVLDLLVPGGDAPTVIGKGHDKLDFAPVFARLLDLPDAVVLEIVAIVMGETLQVGSAAVEAIGHHLGTDMTRYWQADAAFFSLLRDREVVLAMVAEVAGAAVAEANRNEKAKALKSIIADHLDGANGRAKAAAWVPKWMAFPPAAYTARGGVASVEADARASAEIEAEIARAARAAAAEADAFASRRANSGEDRGDDEGAVGCAADTGDSAAAPEAGDRHEVDVAPPLAA